MKLVELVVKVDCWSSVWDIIDFTGINFETIWQNLKEDSHISTVGQIGPKSFGCGAKENSLFTCNKQTPTLQPGPNSVQLSLLIKTIFETERNLHTNFQFAAYEKSENSVTTKNSYETSKPNGLLYRVTQGQWSHS